MAETTDNIIKPKSLQINIRITNRIKVCLKKYVIDLQNN